MDWPAIVAVGFAAFFVGLLLVSRVLAWVAGLVLLFKSSPTQSGQAGLWAAQFCLHSGPWSLALAISALFYLASLPQLIWFWTALAGSGLAVAILVIALAIAHVKQRRGTTAPVPLTSERLAYIRRRFFWGNTIVYGGFSSAWMLYVMWAQFGQSIGLVVFIIGVCLGGGYVFTWFMWQFYGASLQARESARKRAEHSSAV
jgi:hypothetical protein